MNKIVLITGTSTGIGRACALHLVELGFTVYAGVRTSKDAQALKEEASDLLKPIILDVSDESSISKAATQISSETDGRLDGLINNAGIGLGGALEVTPLEKIYKLIHVNVIGVLAVTKTFIPMLRESKGRIINIGSTSAYLAFPGISVYAASKFAVRAFTDALRLELHHLGIKVILLSPGAIESAIWDKGQAYRKALRENVNPDIAALYGPLLRFGDSLYTDLKRLPALEVARAAADALTNKRPKRYYIVGKDAKGAKKATYLPTALLDRIILKRIEKFA
jgi:NAD(P)-dependent dehydrogenase (short-subunit alcohol dehydrogenase family)